MRATTPPAVAPPGLLTHISDELDADHALAEARRPYAGPLEIARAGAQYVA